MENEAGRAPAETGSREPDPAVPALTGLDPSRGYRAALPHLRRARLAYLAAISGMENPCDEIFSHKYLDPTCVARGCQSLRLKRASQILRNLAFMARTSGGTAGPDAALMSACDEAEAFLRDSDGSPEGRDGNRLDGEAATARAEGIAEPPSEDTTHDHS